MKQPLSKRQKIGFQDQLLLNAGQKYAPRGAFFNTFDLVIKIFVLFIFEWPFYTGFTVSISMFSLTILLIKFHDPNM